MANILTLGALVTGLLMYLLCTNSKAQEIGRMLLFSAILAILIASAPATVHMLR